jgi:hypothetical protein
VTVTVTVCYVQEKSKVCMKCAPTGMVAEVAAIEIAGTYSIAMSVNSLHGPTCFSPLLSATIELRFLEQWQT